VKAEEPSFFVDTPLFSTQRALLAMSIVTGSGNFGNSYAAVNGDAFETLG
jgi:hypothetical protein